jgi:short-subunit dehydrogenase
METKDFGIQITNLAPGDFATNIASRRYHAPVEESSPYKSAYENSLRLMNEHVDSGQDPIKVAEKVYKIINTKKPRIHYRVGNPTQKFSLILKKVLPDKVYERLLINHYKL